MNPRGQYVHWITFSRAPRVVTKISSCRVNTTSRRGNQTARNVVWFYFSPIFQ